MVLVTGMVLLFKKKGSTDFEGIRRPSSGTAEIPLRIRGKEQTEEFILPVHQKEMTDGEWEEALRETLFYLTETMNSELLKLRGAAEDAPEQMMLPKGYEKTGAIFSFTSSDETICSREGTIFRSGVTKPTEVTLKAKILLCSETAEKWFSFTVYPYPEGSEKKELAAVKQKLLEAEQETIEQEAFRIPEKIGGFLVERTKDENAAVPVCLLFLFFVPVAVAAQKRKRMKKEKEKKEAAYLSFYPQMITKLTLYNGAGLSITNAWELLAREYRMKRENNPSVFCPEELLILAGELHNGSSEEAAYKRFTKKVCLSPYKRCFALLLSQQQKGTGGLREKLFDEVTAAWEQHRRRVEEKSEEAQTKLLFPMMGMLFLVFLLVMVPAFLSMG